MQTDRLDRIFVHLIDEIENFSVSEETSAIIYDTTKLSNILKAKQVTAVCNPNETRDSQFLNIHSRLGKIVTELIANARLEHLTEYQIIEQEIEDYFNGDFYLYAKQSALSVKSLYYYKRKDYEKAHIFTLECIALNEYLIQRGIHILIYRCIEQNKNLARIKIRNGDITGGYLLNKCVLSYLFSGNAIGLHGNLFNENLYRENVSTLREYYAYEIFLMMVQDEVYSASFSSNLTSGLWYQDLQFDVDTKDRQIIYNWIYINNQLRNGKYEEYIDGLIYFLKQPISFTYDICKISLLQDLIKLVEQNEVDNKKVIYDLLSTYFNTKIISHNRYQNTLSFNGVEV